METTRIHTTRRVLYLAAAAIACFIGIRLYRKSQQHPVEDPEVRLSYWRSMLTDAAKSGNLPMFQGMLGNVTPNDQFVPNALYWAGRYGYVRFFRWWDDSNLPHKTTQVPNLFNAPLIAATQFGHKDLTTYLLAHGADPNTGSGEGWTPLALAVHNKNTEVVQALLKAGARVDTPVQGNAPTWQGLTVYPDGRVTPVPVEFKTKARSGEPPIVIAARNRDLPTARLLLQHGAKPNYRSPKGVSALEVAQEQDDSAFVALLKGK